MKRLDYVYAGSASRRARGKSLNPFDLSKMTRDANTIRSHRLEIVGGRFSINGRAGLGRTGQRCDLEWVNSRHRLVRMRREHHPFCTGMDGTGLTEDLSKLAERMKREGTPFYHGVPGLLVRSTTRRSFDRGAARWQCSGTVSSKCPGRVSGRGTAWDGLSKFDLTQFNPWYFQRTREFADLCEQHGLVIYHNCTIHTICSSRTRTGLIFPGVPSTASMTQDCLNRCPGFQQCNSSCGSVLQHRLRGAAGVASLLYPP